MNFKKGFATVLAGIIVSLSANAAREPLSPGANVPPVSPAGSHALQKAAAAESDASDSDDAANGNPYALIISRNVFHLNPAPVPPPVGLTNAPPPGTLKFTGFIKTSGEPVRGLFVNITKEATNTAYYNLKEGERQGDFEVLKLHEEIEAAEVMQAGTRLTLWLTNSRPTSIGGPAAPGAPGAPGAAPAAPQQVAQFNPGGGVSVGVAGAIPLPAPGTAAIPPTTIPTRTIRAMPQQQVVPQSLAESVDLMARDAASHKQEIDAGLYPPPPPVPGMNPNLNGGEEANNPMVPPMPVVPNNPRRFGR